MGKWVPKFSSSYAANIWNIHLVSDGQILLELREPSEEQLEFVLINLNSGSAVRLGLTDPPWFSQLVHIDEAYLLLQVYEDDQNPDRVSLLSYTRSGGKPIWQKSGVQFMRSYGESYAGRKSDGSIVYLEPLSGNESNREPNLRVEAVVRPEPEFPVHYREGESHFGEIAAYVRQHVGVEVVRAADYAEKNNHIFLSYYKSMPDSRLGLDLLVLNNEGQSVLFEDLAKDLGGIADPTFMFFRGNLIFVKEKRHFFVYALPTED